MNDLYANVSADPSDACPLLIDDTIPPTTALDTNGNEFDVNEAVATQRTILIFFRGGW